MATVRTKANIGLALFLFFLAALLSGIILHLKSHGIVVEPRSAIKLLHGIAGAAMAFICYRHATQFRKAFSSMKSRSPWFWYATSAVTILVVLTFISGAIKFLSPVKIPHLGLWHYIFGVVMSVAIALHLLRGIPCWIRMRKSL